MISGTYQLVSELSFQGALTVSAPAEIERRVEKLESALKLQLDELRQQRSEEKRKLHDIERLLLKKSRRRYRDRCPSPPRRRNRSRSNVDGESEQKEEPRKAKATNLELRRNWCEEWIQFRGYGEERRTGSGVLESGESEAFPEGNTDSTTEATTIAEQLQISDVFEESKGEAVGGTQIPVRPRLPPPELPIYDVQALKEATDLKVKKLEPRPLEKNGGAGTVTPSTPTTAILLMAEKISEVKVNERLPPPEPPDRISKAVVEEIHREENVAESLAGDCAVENQTHDQEESGHQDQRAYAAAAGLETQAASASENWEKVREASQRFQTSEWAKWQQHGLNPSPSLMGLAQQKNGVANGFCKILISYERINQKILGSLFDTKHPGPIASQLSKHLNHGNFEITLGLAKSKTYLFLLVAATHQKLRTGKFVTVAFIIYLGHIQLSLRNSNGDIETPSTWVKTHLRKTSNIDECVVGKYQFVNTISLLLEPLHYDTKMVVNTRMVAKRPPPEPPDHGEGMGRDGTAEKKAGEARIITPIGRRRVCGMEIIDRTGVKLQDSQIEKERNWAFDKKHSAGIHVSFSIEIMSSQEVQQLPNISDIKLTSCFRQGKPECGFEFKVLELTLSKSVVPNALKLRTRDFHSAQINWLRWGHEQPWSYCLASFRCCEISNECCSSEDQEEIDFLHGGQAQSKLSSSESSIEKIDNFLSFERPIVLGFLQRELELLAKNSVNCHSPLYNSRSLAEVPNQKFSIGSHGLLKVKMSMGMEEYELKKKALTVTQQKQPHVLLFLGYQLTVQTAKVMTAILGSLIGLQGLPTWHDLHKQDDLAVESKGYYGYLSSLSLSCLIHYWDPGGCSYFSATTWSTSFKQWDPGGDVHRHFLVGQQPLYKERFLHPSLRTRMILRGEVMMRTQIEEGPRSQE